MLNSILLIDDEKATTEGLQRLLRDQFEVETAASVAEAIGKMKKREFSVVVTDMRMAHQTGADFLRIANREFRKPIKIILSAYVDEFFDERFQTDLRPFAVLKKPLHKQDEFIQLLHDAVFEYEYRFGSSETSVPEKGFLDAAEVMQKLGVSRPTLYKLLKAGLPSKRVGGRRLFNWGEVAKWVNAHDSQGP